MKLSLKSSAAALLILSSSSSMCASVADIAFVIDQSGSMGGEFNWLSSSIETINQRVIDAGITARYAVAGYERDFGLNGYGDDRNIYQDFSSDITDITDATTDVTTYGSRENSYNAAVNGTTGFSWSDSAVKVMILITDEPSPQSGDTYSESEVGNIMSEGDFLLNIIAPNQFQENWDDAAYSTDDYLGFFDLDLLRDNPETFTALFTEAKIEEITSQPSPVPLPAAFWLFATGLLGLIGFKRNSRSAP